MTKTKPVTYYASNTNYFLRGKKLTKYLVHADNTTYERYEEEGNLSRLKEVGIQLSDFYKKHESVIRLHNCTIPKLEGGQYRPLTQSERKIFLEALTGKNISNIEDSPHPEHLPKFEDNIDSRL